MSPDRHSKARTRAAAKATPPVAQAAKATPPVAQAAKATPPVAQAAKATPPVAPIAIQPIAPVAPIAIQPIVPAAIQLSAPTDGLLAPTDELPTPTDELPTPTDELPTPTDELPTPTEELPTPTEELPTPTEELPTPEAARVARRANLSEELEWYSAYDTDARSYNNEKFGMVILDAVKNFMPAALILMKAHGWHPMIAESARILRQSLAVLRELAPCLASNRAFMSHFDSLRQIALAYPTDEYERNKSGNRKPL